MVDIENLQHCDFLPLRNMLIKVNMLAMMHLRNMLIKMVNLILSNHLQR